MRIPLYRRVLISVTAGLVSATGLLVFMNANMDQAESSSSTTVSSLAPMSNVE